MVKYYQVGGSVRDSIIGIKSKDIDYAVEAESYDDMRLDIINRGGKIYLEKPEYLTIRAKILHFGDCDFVLCRKDGNYYDGRRPESVEPGTLFDDLSRRDFTMNAIAINESGKYIDYFNGIRHINHKLIVCVGNAEDRFAEDSLRLIRALRFSITKGFSLDSKIDSCLKSPKIVSQLKGVSPDRIREEMNKMFAYDTFASLVLLQKYWRIRNYVFDNGVLSLKVYQKGTQKGIQK